MLQRNMVKCNCLHQKAIIVLASLLDLNTKFIDQNLFKKTTSTINGWCWNEISPVNHMILLVSSLN